MLKSQGAVSIKDVLPDVIAKISRGDALEQITLESEWKKIAGPDSGKAVFSGMKDGTVFVNMDCSARLYQWKMRKNEILRLLKEKFPSVQNIIFRIGKVK